MDDQLKDMIRFIERLRQTLEGDICISTEFEGGRLAEPFLKMAALAAKASRKFSVEDFIGLAYGCWEQCPGWEESIKS